MAGIVATYVAGTMFTVPSDMTAEFCIYRRVKADCGVDGYAYGTVGSSEYNGATGKTTVSLGESVLTANLESVWFGVVAGGSSGALPDEYIQTLGKPDILAIDDAGDDRGENAINLQTGRTDPANVAGGGLSISVGYDAASRIPGSVCIGPGSHDISLDPAAYSTGWMLNESGTVSSAKPGVAVGYNAYGITAAVAVGGDAVADRKSVAIGALTEAGPYCCAIGAYATAQFSNYKKGVSVGYGATSLGGGVAVGQGSYGDAGVAVGRGARGGSDAVSVGGAARAYNGSVALGDDAYVAASRSIVIGKEARTEVAYSAQIAGGIITRNTYNGTLDDEFVDYTAAEITIMTNVLDLTTATTTEIPLPTGGTFYPNEVGLIITDADTVSVQPGMQYGTDATNIDVLLAETTTTGLDAFGDRERFTSLLTQNGIKSVAVRNNTPATATTLTARAYWQGLWVEDEVD